MVARVTQWYRSQIQVHTSPETGPIFIDSSSSSVWVVYDDTQCNGNGPIYLRCR